MCLEQTMGWHTGHVIGLPGLIVKIKYFNAGWKCLTSSVCHVLVHYTLYTDLLFRISDSAVAVHWQIVVDSQVVVFRVRPKGCGRGLLLLQRGPPGVSVSPTPPQKIVSSTVTKDQRN